MQEPVPYAMGADVRCTDGPCGRITGVVVDPLAKTVTHIVVAPAHWPGLGRLVPVSLADASGGDVSLRCTLAEFDQLEPAEETQFISGVGSYGPVLAWPYYSLGGVAPGGGVPPAISYDKVPAGEVEVHRGDRVQASDGAIGHVQGLVVDPRSAHVTHVLLREGHLWGRKQVAIPISAVAELREDGIRLRMTREEVGGLPPVDIDQGI